MKRVVPGLIAIVMLSISVQCIAAPLRSAALAGVVRDAHGTPQLGAMVTLLTSDASVMATAFTDDHGRYIIAAIHPGSYQLRATAAFFLPITRTNIRLQSGAQSVVNLTMSTLFEAESWLPATRRRADEPADDWRWALRSSANRPLLRLVDDDGISVSTSAEHSHTTSTQGRVSVTSGDGAFGSGGLHQVLVLNRTIDNGDGSVLRADVGSPQSPFPIGPSISVSAGYEKRSIMNGNTRLVGSVQSHPELTDGNQAGFAVLRMASTQQFSLGDAVLIDAGTLMAAEKLQASRLSAQPYVRVTARMDNDIVVEYRFATGRELQGSEDLDRLKPALTVLTDAKGKPLSTKGLHNEVSISKKLDGRVMTFSVFSDQFDSGALAGSGVLQNADLQGSSIVADPTTGSFHLATAGYSGRGMSGVVMQPITPALSLWAQYDLGTAVRSTREVVDLKELQKTLTAHTTQAASLALRGKLLKTGTSVKAQYRWQPSRTLTQVNAYNNSADEAYLSFYLRQKLWFGRWLPQGVDAVVEATNLLEQGYQPVLAPDGHTLFLAQIPRAIQGGLAFNF